MNRYAKPMTFLTPDELLALLKAARQHSARAWASILIAYKHGLRCSEVCNLLQADVNLKTNQITVNRLKDSMNNVQNLEKQKGKPLLDERKAIEVWMDERLDDSDFLFTSQKGGQMDPSAFFRLFQSIAKLAGLPQDKQHPHILKHSIASHMVGMGTALPFIRQHLGHKSMSSTMLYAHVTDEQADTATRKAMAAIF